MLVARRGKISARTIRALRLERAVSFGNTYTVGRNRTKRVSLKRADGRRMGRRGIELCFAKAGITKEK